MIDVDELLRRELERSYPAPQPPDWDAVLELAGAGRARSAPRWQRRVSAVGVLAVVAAAFAAVALATPLGSAIARGIGGFSAWVTGEPGKPAPKADQQAFNHANARSWLGFPAGTQLRLLTTQTDAASGTHVGLLGFRAGSLFCLRVEVRGATHGSQQTCAPIDELKQAGAPVRVLLVDQGFGKGSKQAWYGLDRYHAPALQVSAGISADNVKTVTLEDRRGSHTVPAESNAFLYVAWNPDVAQRVSDITAGTRTGTMRVPFARVPFGIAMGAPAGASPTGPTTVQRVVHDGSIGWLDRRAPVEQPLSVLPRRQRPFFFTHTVFGRVVTPDPGEPIRVAVTLNTSRNGGKATGVCTSLVSKQWGGGGGCAVRADLFTRGPLTSGSVFGGSSQYSLVTGLASDDVAQIIAYLGNGQTRPVSLADNVYLAEIAESAFPVRLVSYDRSGKIIGVSPVLGDLTPAVAPAVGKARELMEVTGWDGGTARLYVGDATGGGNCMYVRWYESKHANGILENCAPARWRGPALQVGGGGTSGIWEGRSRADVTSVEMRFADGYIATIKPKDGFILYAAPKAESSMRDRLVMIGKDKTGHEVGRETLPPQKH